MNFMRIFFTTIAITAIIGPAWAEGRAPAGVSAVPGNAADTAVISSSVPSGAPAIPDIPVAPQPSLSIAGAALSAVVPGAGQVFHKRYLLGGAFLAAEASAAGFALYWYDSYEEKNNDSKKLRDTSGMLRAGIASSADTAAARREAGLYSVLADQAKLQARQAEYTVYCALSWAAGIYLFNVLDALEPSGITSRSSVKNPSVAGFLSAVPFLGLGQFYNGRPGKAGMLAMTQTSLFITAAGHQLLMDTALPKYNEMRDPESDTYEYRADHLAYWKSQYDRSFSRRNMYLWLSLFSYIYTIIDAVVDAHLSDYQERVKIGPDLAVGANGIDRVGVALNIEF
jgi:hypothetical protein